MRSSHTGSVADLDAAISQSHAAAATDDHPQLRVDLPCSTPQLAGTLFSRYENHTARSGSLSGQASAVR